VHTDGRFRLYVDDRLIFDNVSVPKYILNQATIDLSKASHKVVLEVYAQRRASSVGVSMGIASLATIVDPDAIKMAQMADAVGHVRTVPIPDWVKSAVDSWVSSAALHRSVLFCSVSKTGKVWGSGFTAKVIWSIVRGAASDRGFGAVAPHDLRRTCARLCHQAGGEFEQIQFLLGHVSVQITLTNGHQPLSV
jgi:site-specific recombinase XerC